MMKILVAFALAALICVFAWMGSADSSQTKVKGWTCLSIPFKVIKGKTKKAANAKCVRQCAALACRATACGSE